MKVDRSEILDRIPPQNLDAEKGVLGSILLDPKVCDNITLILRGEDFYAPAHVRLFGHLTAMHNEGLRIDSTLLVERLKKAHDLELVGGMGYLIEVVQSVPTAANALHYARVVRDKAALRSIVHASTDALRAAYDQDVKPADVSAKLEQALLEIGEHRDSEEPLTVEEIVPLVAERLDQRISGKSEGLHTGFPDVDIITGGLHPSELTILAARPTMGKSTLASNIAGHLAIDQGCAVLFISLEMNRLELVERLLCSVGDVSAHKTRIGQLDDNARRRFVEAGASFHRRQLLIDDTPGRTVGQIAAIARRQKRKRLDVLVIDYLQLIEPDNPKDNRQEQVAKIARRLKLLARELCIPVLCLAQLNRQAEAVVGGRPKLSHLRESGAIEQDADVVLFIHRDPKDPDLHGMAELLIAKNRHGPTADDVKLVWRPDQMQFASRARVL